MKPRKKQEKEKKTPARRELLFLSLCPPAINKSPPRVPVIITSPSPFPSSCIGRKFGSCRCCTIRTRSSPSSSESRISIISILCVCVYVRAVFKFNPLYETLSLYARFRSRKAVLSFSHSHTHNARRTTTTSLCILSFLCVCLCVCVSARYSIRVNFL